MSQIDIFRNLTVYAEKNIKGTRKKAFAVEEDFETANKIANKYGYHAVKASSEYAPEITKTYVVKNSTGHLKDF